ncbi:myb-like DNA-binding domain protein [Ichthyophthirius multifiliis]|uniref:Myb-like DNA-binding domain protein n=1 Tax=Ichthyophthirius multifiliis TaxID=5932 RepID=G0QWC5_ICHMU|nr:myb-like DNA-binding domain protein [Ichthyophthirius multifiliis]EGR30472.1 myb-like DNA-binding domain protein [Ichthyophthirius multifiliis]|eukprot:XP_004032059.1 myb-like DNA-binding domain protein [Ichthyophthirius multifiliis]
MNFTSIQCPWTQEEDNLLKNWISIHGAQKWSLCSETIKGRSGKQCRERWFNNLSPDVKRGLWSPEEDDIIFRGYLTNGSCWRRTENSVKNRFYSTVRKLLSDSDKNLINKMTQNQLKLIIENKLNNNKLLSKFGIRISLYK